MTVANTPNDGNLTPDQIAARDAVIQADYCAGIKPLRQIGSEHSLSHTATGKMAKERGWIRNLNAKIQAKADSKVAKAAVSKTDSNTSLVTESSVVEADALVPKAAVSAEVSLTIANTKVSAAVVSALVSALNDLEFLINFRRLSDIQTLGRLTARHGENSSIVSRAWH